MFPITETVLSAEADYRREQLLASLPVRRGRARRRAVTARIVALVGARRAAAATRVATGTATPTAPPRAVRTSPVSEGCAAAQAQGTPSACAA